MYKLHHRNLKLITYEVKYIRPEDRERNIRVMWIQHQDTWGHIQTVLEKMYVITTLGGGGGGGGGV